MITLITYLPRIENQYYTLPQEKIEVNFSNVNDVCYYIKCMHELKGELTIEVKGE